jgi:ABC-2 type transport system ATP-binding protein
MGSRLRAEEVGVEAAGADPAVLGVRGLRKSYGNRLALSDVSFEARRGELVACIGPNGAGKTTLLSILAEIQDPDSGSVVRPSGTIGWVPQEPALYRKLTVAENLTLFARLEKAADIDGVVARMLAESGLSERADEQASKLSGGNRQRLNIAIGLLSTPAVLLLDEPSAGLDPRQREVLWTFINELARDGTAVVYSTHDVSEAERYADRVLVLADGERLFWGTPDELRGTVAGERSFGDGDLEAAFVAFLHQRGH